MRLTPYMLWRPDGAVAMSLGGLKEWSRCFGSLAALAARVD